MEQKKSVGIWIRVSTEDQAKGESPEHHEQRARYYAEAKGWAVKEVYHLEGFSGKSVMAHPETQRMLKDIKEGSITGLIFSKLARLARNTRELLDFSDIFRGYNADLVSLQESIDTSSPAGRLFYTLIAAMAQWEREEIAERVSASVPVRAKMGKPLGGQASFGFKWVDKQLMIDEKEAPVRKLMYELFLKYKRMRATAKALNDMGHRTRNGAYFSNTTVERLIRDTSAKGIRRANYTQTLGDNKSWTIKAASEWVMSPCPAIVPEDLWNECNRILDEQDQKKQKPGRTAVHLLSGFIHCTCGKKMYVYTGSKVYKCNECKNRIAIEDIDEIFHNQLKTFLLSDSDVDNYLSKSDLVIKEKETLLATISKESIDLEKESKELVEMRMRKEMSPDSFTKYYKPIEERLTQITANKQKLESEIDILKVQYMSSDVVIREAQNLFDRWPELPFEEKRTIVEVITERITIGKEDIDIKLSYLPNPTTPNDISKNPTKGSHDFRDSCWL